MEEEIIRLAQIFWFTQVVQIALTLVLIVMLMRHK